MQSSDDYQEALRRIAAEAEDGDVMLNLDLNNTQVADLAPLLSLSELQRLYLGGTKITDFTPLQTFSKLQSLGSMTRRSQTSRPFGASQN